MSFTEGGSMSQGRRGFRSLIDRLPGTEKRRQQERRKNELIQSFMIKALHDLETDGFSIRKKELETDVEPLRDYRGKITSRLVYVNGKSKYQVSFSADVIRPLKPIEYTSETQLTLSFEDEHGGRSVQRGGYVVKTKIHSAFGIPRNYPTHIASIKLDMPDDNGEREYHGFHSRDESSFGETPLSTDQTIKFLEELLQAKVDPESTQQLLATIQEEVDTMPWMRSAYDIGEVYWNRERPGAMARFLAVEQ
jgi:hypothetical protein